MSTSSTATPPRRRTCSSSTPCTVAGGTTCTASGDALAIDGAALGYSRATEPGGVAWGDLGIEIVLECTGRFRTRELLDGYFRQGVRTVIVAAPVKKDALNIVVGVNDHLYDPARHDVVTAASCTTNCLAPIVKVVHEGIGIRRGSITTLHDMTNTQTLVDAPHKDLRRARAATLSLIPTTTGSATAIGLIFPELEGRLDGLAVRVPLLNASLTDCVFEVARPTTVEEVNGLLRRPPTARSRASSGSSAGRSSPSTTRTTRARRSSMRRPRWSPTGRRSRSSPGTTTSGATPTAWPSSHASSATGLGGR